MSGKLYHADDDVIVAHIVDRMAKMRPSKFGPLSKRQIAAMLSVAFAASLESDEHRPVSFSLFYTRDGYPIDYLFRDQAPLTPGALVRLSAALDPSRSSIGVTGDGDLKVAGIWHTFSLHTAALMIRVVGPGIFLVKYDANPILTYRRGQFVAYPGTFDTEHDAESLLRQPEPVFVEPGRVSHSLNCRLRIVAEMVRLAHGGTLLFVPTGGEWKQHVASEGFPPATPSPRVLKVEHLAYEMVQMRQVAFAALAGEAAPSRDVRHTYAANLLGGHEIRADLEAELEAIATLTATDGMVLVRPDLTLLGFGVFFSMESPECAIEVYDPYETGARTVTRLSELGGARHQSSAVAAIRVPGALAVVASSDGSLTAMRRPAPDGPLVIHKHLELRLPRWSHYQ